MRVTVEQQAEQVMKNLVSDPRLGPLVDPNLRIPRVYQGTGDIRAIILGQDPTVKDPVARASIRVVLNLDRHGNLRKYLQGLCGALGIDLAENVYATNYLKNFFIKPPTQIKHVDVLKEASSWWLPLLREELSRFRGVPVVTLGEPLLSALVREGARSRLRDYWGYTSDWRFGGRGPFGFVRASESHLDRRMFPFPHQPSVRKRFYRERLSEYAAFVKQTTETWQTNSTSRKASLRPDRT